MASPGHQPCGARTGDTRQEDTCGQAAVEQDGKPNVAAGLAALAEHLDENSARDAGDYSDRNRCSAGQQCQADTGESHVAEAVTQQAHATLDDVGSDGGCDQTCEQCGDQGTLHKGIGQDFNHGSTAPPSQLSAPSP